MGQKVKVERHEVASEASTKGNGLLRDIGELVNPIPNTLKYVGSMAVHIYQSEMLRQVFFMGQAQTLGDTPEETASAALTNLKGDAMNYYGRARKTKRSGF